MTTDVQDRTKFELIPVDREEVEKLAPVFDALEADPYLGEGYRFRGYTLFYFENGELVRQPSHSFYQSPDINKIWGGMERRFTELTPELERLTVPLVQRICKDFVTRWGLDPDDLEVGIHPIRTVCVEGSEGHPAPEGLHTDGFMLSSLLVVQRHNVEGALTRLYGSYDESDVIYERTLQPGEFLIFDDSRLFHYTSPVTPAGTGRAFRDVMVLCISQKGAHAERGGMQRTEATTGS